MINWIIGGVIILAMLLAVRYLWKQNKKGQCAGGCAGCGQSGCCGRIQAGQLEEEIEKKK